MITRLWRTRQRSPLHKMRKSCLVLRTLLLNPAWNKKSRSRTKIRISWKSSKTSPKPQPISNLKSYQPRQKCMTYLMTTTSFSTQMVPWLCGDSKTTLWLDPFQWAIFRPSMLLSIQKIISLDSKMAISRSSQVPNLFKKHKKFQKWILKLFALQVLLSIWSTVQKLGKLR
jgi:hypothetical protein